MPARKEGSRSVERADANLLGAQSLIANKLYDADGNFVGRLEEIVLDVRTVCVRHVIVAVGGVLGIGRQRFAVPWSAVAPDARYCRAVIDLAQLRLAGVRISNDDPWSRQAPATNPSSVSIARGHRALGMGD